MYYSLFIALIMMWSAIAMESQNKILFSVDQRTCFDFFDKNPSIKDKAFKRLAVGERNNFNIFAHYFFEEMHNANIAIPFGCNAQILEQTLQDMKVAIEQELIKKPTNMLTARIYAFSLLTPEKQKIISPENYKNNKQQANEIIWEIASTYACRLFDLKLVPLKEVCSTASSFFESKIKELENY